MGKFQRLILLMLLGIFLEAPLVRAQQLPLYSQYMFNMLNINPAYAGNRGTNCITALYRDQWIGMKGAPNTAIITWDKRENESNVGYGMQVYNDGLGIENTTGFQGFYSYRLPFYTSSLTFGISGGVLNYSYRHDLVDVTGTGGGTGGDIAYTGPSSAFLPSVGFGALYSARNWYISFSIPSLLKTKIDIDKLNLSGSGFGSSNHYFLAGGYNMSVNEYLDLKPSVLVKAVAGAPVQFDLNLTAWMQNIVGLGFSYRTDKSVVAMAEIQVTPFIRIGYAFDYSMAIGRYNSGSHELMLRYEFATNNEQLNILSPRYY